ncbi:unnamed protein product [Diatraea saccharalis]|uniref:CCHC-type domain-containing protein n=1 Tax=Diatraea saccharalis TaxID=40085 RepID=A0A9N9R5B4_9NEOP|nr:unnamed protein product [Diatraea saccharalis]
MAGNNVIPEFDPLSKNQTVANWITKVEECAEIYKWNESEMIHYALPKLVGLAKSWYQNLPTVRYTWAQWKVKLNESFPCRENYADLLIEMLSLRVRFGESLEQYFYSKLNLLNRCKITGNQAVDFILQGIDDRSVKIGAQAAQFDSPEQVLTYLKTVRIGNNRDFVSSSNRFRQDRKHVRNNSSGNNKTLLRGSKPPIKCFNCGLEGHPSFLCTKLIEKCSNCHRIGHKVTSYPYINKNNEHPISSEKQVLKVTINDICCTNPAQEQNNPINELNFDNDLKLVDMSRKYFMTIGVNQNLMDCFIDLGSECSLMRYSDALNLNVELQTDSLPVLKGIGNNHLHAKARIEVENNVQDIILPIEMYVVDDDVIKQPVLLGQNFTEHPNIILTKTSSELLFENTIDASKLYLIVSDTTIIPQYDIKLVPIVANKLYSGIIYIDGSIRGKIGHQYYLLPGEYHLKHGKCSLLVQNITINPIKFTANSLMTRAIPVSSIREASKLSIDVIDKEINCSDLLNEPQRQELKNLLNNYNDCFSENLQDLGFTTMIEMEIRLTDSDPIVYRPYRMSLNEKTHVREMVQEMIDANIVRESSSPYASPILLVKKKTGANVCVWIIGPLIEKLLKIVFRYHGLRISWIFFLDTVTLQHLILRLATTRYRLKKILGIKLLSLLPMDSSNS